MAGRNEREKRAVASVGVVALRCSSRLRANARWEHTKNIRRRRVCEPRRGNEGLIRPGGSVNMNDFVVCGHCGEQFFTQDTRKVPGGRLCVVCLERGVKGCK